MGKSGHSSGRKKSSWFAIFVLLVGLVSTVVVALPERTTAGRSHAEGYEPIVDNSQTIPLLRAASNIDPNPSRGGGDVRVVDGEALVADAGPFGVGQYTKEKPASPDQISLYLVEEGDTLSQIAEMFGVSVNTVLWANDLSSAKSIRPGMTLLILPINGVQHEVQKGETVASIAKKYGGDADEIIRYNGLSEGALRVGSVVTIPGGEEPTVVKTRAVSKGGSKGGATSGGSSSGLIHPLPGSVKTQGLHGYNGLDFGAPAGTPIRAAAGGTVIVSKSGGWNGGYGNYVVVNHPNGTQTLYAHLSKNAVWQGQSVVQGQIIGYVGNTGRSTGNHLHFEVRGAKNPF